MHQALNVSQQESLRFKPFESPFGPAVAGFVGGDLGWLSLGSKAPGPSDWPFGPLLEEPDFLPIQMDCVFEAWRESGTLPKIALRGTGFQLKVWHALQSIPPGHTVSYSELARSIGHPRAVRAVGTAVGANRIAVLVPCHRVVRADGKLGGYRWGVDLKRRILQSEGIP